MTTATVTVLRGGGDFLACGSSAPAASGSLTSAVAVAPEAAKGTSFSPKQLTAAVIVSMVTSRVMGVASLGVEAWLVSVS